MNTLYILQGPTGFGKSTLAKILAAGDRFGDTVVCSTDEFFMVDGVYKFDPSKLGEYHKANLVRSLLALAKGKNVVVDNTNIMRWQCRDYVKYAVDHGIHVVFIRVSGGTYFGTTHGVPEEKMKQMQTQMEDLTIESVLASKSPWE